MRTALLLLALSCGPPAAAQTISGHAYAIDGDTLDMAGQRIRLFGVDAPESMQTCEKGRTAWACGQEAKRLLAQMVEGRAVSCTAGDRDHYGRIVATCYAGQSDLSGVLVREGLAIALPQFTGDYVAFQARAKQYGLGLWSSNFQTPGDFRQANPALFAAKAPKANVAVAARPTAARRVAASTSSWSYRNCAQARAAGAAPLYRGQPGYGAHMDGDGDGIACEPYRR
jgi:endonuclease YncB( thermonuclease family)